MRKICFTLLSLFLTSLLLANNITVSNTLLSGQNTASHYTLVNFDVAWENSWHTSTNESNYDGAWVFVKYRKNGTTDWRHCTISATGNTAAAGATLFIPADNKGAFVYRSTDGLGAVNFTGNKLQWNYGADGVLDNETVEIRVFALEMVYIPQGRFQLGSGGSESNAFMDGTSNLPYAVASNSAITLGTTTGTLNPNGMGPTSGSLPASYPKGFNAFWIMKYECSQQQYVDFLNHLDAARATFNYSPGTYITGNHPNLVAAAPERGAGYISLQRNAALADWSGLRPMTELEFEKVCRGYNTPAVPNEYVWGNTTLNALITVNDAGTATESVATPASANAAINNQYSSSFGVRTGLFARPTGSTRTLSGGTYYGVMNMGDNFTEISFTITNPQGRSIDAAAHGDGYLANTGTTDVAAWQAYQAYGFRGGSYNSGVIDAQTSHRGNANLFFYGDQINPQAGSRLVRSAL